MRKILQLRKHDIKMGRRHHARYCPIALALKRGFPEMDDIYVSHSQVRYFKPISNILSFAALSKKLRQFVDRFDNKKPVKPFKFAIAL